MINAIIAADPSAITIIRHTKVPNAGGSNWPAAPVTSYPFDVRLYFISSRNQRESTLPGGEIKRVDLGMLAPWGTDIVVGHDSYDDFVFEGRTYRIIGVREYDDANISKCIQCDCSAV